VFTSWKEIIGFSPIIYNAFMAPGLYSISYAFLPPESGRTPTVHIPRVLENSDGTCRVFGASPISSTRFATDRSVFRLFVFSDDPDVVAISLLAAAAYDLASLTISSSGSEVISDAMERENSLRPDTKPAKWGTFWAISLL